MLEYLMFEMIYSGLDESNNILRFAKFADLQFKGWRLACSNPLPVESLFLDCYQLWLCTNYPANDGKAGALGGADQGVVRYGPSNNTARLVATCHKNVCALYNTVKTSSNKKVTKTAYATMISTQSNNTLGTSKLQLQKML